MLNFLFRDARGFKILLVAGLCAGASGGCGSSGVAATKDPSQDLTRLKSGPSPEDIKAMQSATANSSSNVAPPAASKTP